jgi:hypothetical protein
MKAFTLAPLLLSLTSTTAFAAPRPERIPVAIRLVGDDGLTQKLTWALENELQRNALLRLATPTERGFVSIESDSNVNWDKLNGRTVIIYTVYVSGGDKRGPPHTGICYETQISKCVSAITRIALITAQWTHPFE